ncbi:sigma-70 family RNA polymerase sigma factor (plasmid) [Qingshengfaniella alkalisoli]|uniref:Sigma-70 family RNA polymerase sigma factor n=2 Tax=Qingshengfaniella alkalisoli TaxID=2599296 RepID=A0A5B8IBB9_9RHOB|nr:sigma-70 family RNA polymerase sigma factor [Qingshengfaniella alkalisoli]
MIAIRDRRDKAAFAELFDHFAPRLKSVLVRNGASDTEAEDIIQDAMLTLWQKAHLFDARRAQVSTWIYQIARNRQIDRLRKTTRPIPADLFTSGEDTNQQDDIFALEQEADALRRALAELPVKQKEILEKAYFSDATHAEIREDTGLPLGTIKSRIRLGLDRLRHELKHLRPS